MELMTMYQQVNINTKRLLKKFTDKDGKLDMKNYSTLILHYVHHYPFFNRFTNK